MNTINGEGDGPGTRPERLHMNAILAKLWERTMTQVLKYEKLCERAPNVRFRSRLSAMAAGGQAHASRLLARLAAVGGAPLPVPPDEVDLDREWGKALIQITLAAMDMAYQYAIAANVARKASDPASAWTCELNRAECLDVAGEVEQWLTGLGLALPTPEEREQHKPPPPPTPKGTPSPSGGGKAA